MAQRIFRLTVYTVTDLYVPIYIPKAFRLLKVSCFNTSLAMTQKVMFYLLRITV